MAHYVIVGASAGAVGAVEGIRTLDPSGEVTVISEEAMAPYSRPSISEYLDGRVDESSLRFGLSDFWAENNAKTILGRRVNTLTLQDRKLQLDDGQSIGFDKLLLASGAKPIIPRMGGTDKDGFCTFSSIADVSKIKQKLPAASKSVVIGGGLIGIAAAEALANLGIDVTVVELRGWLLNLVLDREAAKIVESTMHRRGVNIVTGQSVQEIIGREDDGSKVGCVLLSSGEHVACDLVVAAIGVTPRTELAVQAGLKVNRGIVVNRFMETSAPDVYACGDVAEAYDYSKDANQVLALWPLARLGGKVAGMNMAGGRVEYPGGVAMSALRYFDIPIISVGTVLVDDSNGYEVLLSSTGDVYKKVVLRSGEIVGFTLVGSIGSAGLLNNLMRSKTDVSKFKDKLLDEAFSFAHLPEALRRKTLMEVWA